jgi:hypothetical protein
MTEQVGLCATCRHSRTVKGARSVFWMCERSRTDTSFPQYPRLPVTRCRGYEADSAKQPPPA